MIEVVDALRALVAGELPPDQQDDSASEPYGYTPERLYAFETGTRRQDPQGQGEVIERFTVRLVWAVPALEEGTQTRDRDVSILLDAIVEQWLGMIRLNTNRDGLWQGLVATVDWDYLRQFEQRGVSVVVSGSRMVW